MNTDKADPAEFVETSLPGFQDEEPDETSQALATTQSWELKSLKPKHLQICALLAQGMKNIEVASIVGVTKEYVSMLLRQPLIKQEILRISSVASVRLEAMFEKSVDIISDVMREGSHQDKLRAVRLHGELTKRIGRPDPMANTTQVSEDRLVVLAERLASLARGARNGTETIIDAEFSVRPGEDRQEAKT